MKQALWVNVMGCLKAEGIIDKYHKYITINSVTRREKAALKEEEVGIRSTVLFEEPVLFFLFLTL